MTTVKAVAAIAITTAIAAAVAGCGDQPTTASKPPTSPMSTPTASASASEVAQISDVSTHYLRAFYAGRLKEANSYVAPSSKGVIKALQLNPIKFSASLDDLRIGQVNVTGTRATVVFMGAICHLNDGKHEGCLTNNDPKSTDDNFGLDFAKLNSKWQVYVPRPSDTYSETESTYP